MHRVTAAASAAQQMIGADLVALVRRIRDPVRENSISSSEILRNAVARAIWVNLSGIRRHSSIAWPNLRVRGAQVRHLLALDQEVLVVKRLGLEPPVGLEVEGAGAALAAAVVEDAAALFARARSITRQYMKSFPATARASCVPPP